MTTEVNTAIVRIKPDADQGVVKLYEESCKLLEFAQSRIIKTDDDVKSATNDLSIIAKLKKAIEERRKEYTGPINEHLKVVNKAFTDFTAPLIEADRIMDQKIKAYIAEQKKIREEQERINRLRMEVAQAEAALKNGEITESVNLVEVQPETPKHYRSDAGMIGTVDHWKVEVIDFGLLPDTYKMINQVLLNKVVRAGVHEIPGCRIWNDPDLRITTK